MWTRHSVSLSRIGGVNSRTNDSFFPLERGFLLNATFEIENTGSAQAVFSIEQPSGGDKYFVFKENKEKVAKVLSDISGKAKCKAALQEELGLPVKADTPIIAMVTRLAGHKGLELLKPTTTEKPQGCKSYAWETMIDERGKTISWDSALSKKLRSKTFPGIAKAMAETDTRFENTDVVVICSGSEEAGLRGAKAYVKAHEKELKEIETVVVACDTFRDLETMAVYDRDMSGTVKHDWGVKHLVQNAGKNCGYDLHFESVYIGASDAAAFTQKGIKATGFAAMDPTPPRYYHTRLDNADNLCPEAIEAGIEVMLEAACMYDKEGLPTK